MAIPEEQLNTWAQIGAQTTSKQTYATVKLALAGDEAGYNGKDYSIFLQGSYGNDTNIYKESDVDVVIRLDSVFTYDLSGLTSGEAEAFKTTHGAATYTHKHFQQGVLSVLQKRFTTDVEAGTKAVKIKARGARRAADVLIALQHRKYQHFGALSNDYVTGISFHKSDGTRVMNFPRQHSENLTTKNQACNEWFKHLVRIFKNARQKLIAAGTIETGVAPSYYIEGLLYNVPNDNFGTSYQESFRKCLVWLNQADRSKFLCSNEQYILIDGNADVTWNKADCDSFLTGLIELWNNW